ncbi:hypothetical protein [Aliiglaciecola aliphaticivorans]
MKKAVLLLLACGSLFNIKLGMGNEEVQFANQEDLLFVKGEPSSQKQFEDQGNIFEHYYYHTENQSFLIDVETGRVCNAYIGEQVRSCFPCTENEVSPQCP